MTGMSFADVAIDVPLGRTFTYKIKDKDSHLAKVGARAVVPFRKKMLVGYIVGLDVRPGTTANIKEIELFPDEEPALSKKMLKLIKWVSDYYSAPIGEVCFTATPNLLNSEKEIGKKRNKTSFSHNLEDFHKDEKVIPTKAQTKILKELENLISPSKFSVSLLHGVTGSGKTEIYLRLMERVLKDGKQVVLLVPEITLTPQLAGRVASYFGSKVAVYHSGLTRVQRLAEWQKMKRGDVNIVIGTRSAIFAPFQSLGLIIIDEEHDNSYKQEDAPRYNARDTAIVRGKIEGIPIILGSATPSIETLANARSGKYHNFQLPERHGEIQMPEIKIIDMRREPKSGLLNPHLSVELLSEIKKTVSKGKQVLLFLNRRGFANFIICQDCGEIPTCPNCKVTLTYHKAARGMICHYCNYRIAPPDKCPKCQCIDFVQIGSGTEMIEEVIKKELPNARIARLDRDTATTEKKRRDILSRMHSGKIDILIGTQMITKGHDFTGVTLVGIVSADQSIHFPDFRSSERTFQLITQVSGRSGRSLHPGKVIVQTYSPDHISIKSASEGRLDDYISEELELRRELSYPPFTRIANIRISGNKEESVIKMALKLASALKKVPGTEEKLKLLGPAPAPLSMIKGKTRWQILIKSPSARLLTSTLSSLRSQIDSRPISGVQIAIDVDPVSTM